MTSNNSLFNNGKNSSFSEEAQKKFGNAKAISSDQFFENDKSSVCKIHVYSYFYEKN